MKWIIVISILIIGCGVGPNNTVEKVIGTGDSMCRYEITNAYGSIIDTCGKFTVGDHIRFTK